MRWYLTHEAHGDKPWAVQKEAMRRSKDRDRYGYFLEMGLGKSALTLNDFVHLWSKEMVDMAIVLAPNSFKLNWVSFPEEWGVPEINTGYWPKDKITTKKEMIVVNYEAARSAAGQELLKLAKNNRVMLIIDESGDIKNPSSDTSKAVFELAKEAEYVRELNGTPMVQNVMDWFMQLKVLGELDGKNPYAFRNRYAVRGGYMGKQILPGQMNNETELYNIIDRVGFRALKKDWAKDLPEKIYTSVRLEMTKRQRVHYVEMLEEFYTEIKGGLIVTADIVLTQMEKLRQISSCIIMNEGESFIVETPKNNPKLQALIEAIHGGSTKVVVPYVYSASGEMLFNELSKQKLNPVWVHGKLKEKIKENCDRFNKDPECRVLIGQESCIFRGHTLIGTKDDPASRMMFYETSFSYYHRCQIEDRIHRGDQRTPCGYWDFPTSTVEDIIIKALNTKKDAAGAFDEMLVAIQKELRHG